MNSQSNELSIYIHWPFCKTKCPYCDFNSHENDSVEHDNWEKAYLNEIELNKGLIKGKKIKSIFFGGGTPSLMKPSTVDSIINKISSITDFSNNIEITLEANPNSVDRKRFKDFQFSGINRVSIGIQSIRNNNLQFLGRSHSQYDALKAIEFAREIFDNYSFDLMYCLPGQKINEWESELNEVLKYVDYHISCYQLTIEKSTKFFNALRAEEFQMSNEEISIAMYKATYDILKLHGIKQYEISNYSRAGYECKHNLSYWELASYIGLGPGAHGRYISDNKIYYTINYYNPQKWLGYVDTHKFPIQDKKEIDNKQNMMENDIESRKHHVFAISQSLIRIGDALPALGIVAAVLGVITAMASVGSDPSILGPKIASALVGTFIGAFTAYGLVNPIGYFISKFKEDEIKLIECIKSGIMAHISGYPPSVSIEFARQAIPKAHKPTFHEVELEIENRISNKK